MSFNIIFFYEEYICLLTSIQTYMILSNISETILEIFRIKKN